MNEVVSRYPFVWVLLALPGLLYSQPNVGGSGLLMPNNTAIWFVSGLVVALALHRVLSKRQWAVSGSAHGLGWMLLLIFGLSLVSSSASLNTQLLFAGGFMGAWLFFYALFQYRLTHGRFLRLLTFLCLLGLLHALVATIQLHDPFRVWYTITGYLPFGIVTNRPVGIIQQVNMTATFMATISAAALYIVLSASFQRYHWYWQAMVFAAVLASFYILLLSGSRAGWLSLAIALPLVLMARHKVLKRFSNQFFIWLTILGIAVALAYFFPGKADQELLTNKFDQLSMGTDVRLFLYSYSLQLFLTSPWLGFGLGGYTEAFVNYAQSVGVPEAFRELKLIEFLHPHNELLYWMLQSGVLALVAVVAWVAVYLKKLFKQRVIFALGILGLAMPLLIQAQLSSPFVFSSLHLFLLLFFLHYGIRNEKRVVSLSIGQSSRVLARSALWMLLALWVFAAWWTLKSIQDAYEYEYRLFLTAKQTPKEIREMQYFAYAHSHPAFADEVHSIMNKMAGKALEVGNRYDLQRFLWWAEKQDMSQKSALTLSLQIRAYLIFGRVQAAQALYLEALARFPDDRALLALAEVLKLSNAP